MMVLGMATSIRYASWMVLSSAAVSGLLLWIVGQVVTYLS